MEQNKTSFEIDLLALLYYFWKKLPVIIAATLLFGVAGLLWNIFLVTPQYTASTRIFVLNRSNQNAVASSDYQVSNYMVSDYRELIKGRNLTGEVISKLDLKMSSGTLSNKISVSTPQNTRIVQINVTDADPAQAALLANTVREVAITQLTDIMKVDAATTIYEAEIPMAPSSPNVAKNTVLMAVLGCAIVLLLYTIVFSADRRIRTEEDVERYLGIGTLGIIPDSVPEKKTKKTDPTGTSQRPPRANPGNPRAR